MKSPLLTSLFLAVAATSAMAATTIVSVDSHSEPWQFSPTLNAAYSFGTQDGIAPTVVSSGFDFSAGGSFTITYLAGGTNAFGNAFDLHDGEGDPSYASDNGG